MLRALFAGAALGAFIVATGNPTTASAGQILFPGGAGRALVYYSKPVGQSFVAEDSLVRAGLSFGRMNAVPNDDPLVYGLYEGLGTGGALVASASFSLADDFSGFYLVDFSGTPLTIGGTYSLVVSVDGDSAYWGVDLTSAAPDGTGVMFGSASRTEIALLVEPLSTPVPEPATIGLLGLAVAGLCAARRRGSLRRPR